MPRHAHHHHASDEPHDHKEDHGDEKAHAPNANLSSDNGHHGHGHGHGNGHGHSHGNSNSHSHGGNPLPPQNPVPLEAKENGGYDWRTKASFVGDTISQTCNSYEVGEITNLILKQFAEQAPFIGELSKASFITFLIFATWTSLGAAFCHQRQNGHNQGDAQAHIEEIKEIVVESKDNIGEVKAEEVKRHSKVKMNSALKESLLSSDEQDADEDEHKEAKEGKEDNAAHPAAAPQAEPYSLTFMDWVWLMGDAGAHTIETTSPFIYTVNSLFTEIVAGQLFAAIAFGLILGVLGCWADVRSCYHFMISGDGDGHDHEHDHEHKEEEPEEQIADFWTNFGSFCDIFTSVTTNPVAIGTMIDSYGGYAPINDYISLSQEALIAGLLITSLTTTGNVITHNRFNTNCQHGHQEKISQAELQTRITWFQYMMLKLDQLNHVLGLASKPILMLETIYKKDPLSRFADILSKTGFFAAASFCTLGTIRTCENQTRRYNYRDEQFRLHGRRHQAVVEHKHQPAENKAEKRSSHKEAGIELHDSRSKEKSPRRNSIFRAPVTPPAPAVNDAKHQPGFDPFLDGLDVDAAIAIKKSSSKKK